MGTRVNGLLLCIAAGFSFCGTSFAQNTVSEEAADRSQSPAPANTVLPTKKERAHRFSISPEVSKFEYKEPGLMKDTGTMYGISAGYDGDVGYIKNSIPIQLRGRLNYMRGTLDYEGSLWDGTPYKNGGEHFYFFDTVFAGGMEFKLPGDKFSVSPYVGLGYRYLVDKDDSDPYDYKREQTYYYLPIGADWKTSFAPGWKLTLNTEVDFLLRGENKTHINPTLKFTQKNGYGYKLSARFEHEIVGVFVEPFFRYWSIDESDTQYLYDGYSWHGFVEPKNRTKEYGLRVGVSF